MFGVDDGIVHKEYVGFGRKNRVGAKTLFVDDNSHFLVVGYDNGMTVV